MSEAVKAVCPNCGALNRMLTDKLGSKPSCGKCAADLLPAEPIELTGATFDRIVGKSELPVLVDFWAPWCGPCKMMAPAFAQAAAQLHPSVLFAKLDTQAEQAVGARFSVQSIPTMVLFRGGQESARVSGAMDAGAIVRWARSHIG